MKNEKEKESFNILLIFFHFFKFQTYLEPLTLINLTGLLIIFATAYPKHLTLINSAQYTN